MRKVILNLAVSLDGFIEGPNGEYDWCFNDQDYGMTAFFDSIDTVFMGRKSYDLLSAAGGVDALPGLAKYIFSDTLTALPAGESSIIRPAHFVDRVNEIREQEGKDIWLFGGAHLISGFLNHKLIDRLMLSVHPVLLGGGKSLFREPGNRTDLMHIETNTYPGGLVQLVYIPKPQFDLNTFLG